MVKKTCYFPFQDRSHLTEWEKENCERCLRNSQSCALKQALPKAAARREQGIDWNTAFLIGYADSAGDECGLHIWLCFSLIDKNEANLAEIDIGGDLHRDNRERA